MQNNTDNSIIKEEKRDLMSKNIGIMCSSNKNCNLESRMLAENIAQAISKTDFGVVMGSGMTGLMGQIKEIFSENQVPLEVVGVEGDDDLETSVGDLKVTAPSSFARTEHLYQDSDIILFLPGGVGTLSEFYSMLDYKLEKGEGKPLILYNEDHSFDLVLKDIKERSTKGGFIDPKALFDFEVVNNQKEFDQVCQKYQEEKERVR